MLSTGDFKKGTRFEFEGEPWQILDIAMQSPTARGSTTLVKTKLRNLISGAFAQKTFKSGDKFEEPDLETKDVQYLYKDAEFLHFMDGVSYEHYELTAELVGDTANFLVDEMECRIMFYQDRPIAVSVQDTVVLTITETEPAVRGDTVNAVTKAATLETGFELQVPMFVEKDERIKVDTRDGRYIGRAR